MAKPPAVIQNIISSLTGKEMRFLLEYMMDYDRVRAVKAAGYRCRSDETAATLAARMLVKEKIKKVLKHFEREAQEEFKIERNEVLYHLHACATRNAKDLVDDDGRIIGSVILKNGQRNGGMRINDLPDEITVAIDGMKQKRKVTTYEDGTVVEEIETELKLVSKAAALDMCMKHKVLYSAEVGEIILRVPEDMFRRPNVVDPVGQDVIEMQGRSVVEKTLRKGVTDG